ncbi:MAG: type II toxin-antitoxin system RelE/ParE family toxin [bacterium]
MKTAFRKSFGKDLNKHRKDGDLLSRIREIILEVEAAETLSSIKNIKRLKAEGPYYRIRVGSYRLGLTLEGETVVFVRLLHRREVYRYFP